LTVHVGAFEVLDETGSAAKLEILYTHVTVDEIAAVPDWKGVSGCSICSYSSADRYTPHFRSIPLTANLATVLGGRLDSTEGRNGFHKLAKRLGSGIGLISSGRN